MQSTSCEMLGQMKHKLESRLPGETLITSDTTSRSKKKSQINNLTLCLKQLEKEEMKNPRVSRRKEILKIRAEINAKEITDHSKNQQS